MAFINDLTMKASSGGFRNLGFRVNYHSFGPNNKDCIGVSILGSPFRETTIDQGPS